MKTCATCHGTGEIVFAFGREGDCPDCKGEDMIPDWKCCICGKDADYKQSRKKYCTEHCNYGQPVKPTLKDIVSRETREANGK